MVEKLRNRIFSALDGTIDEESFELLQRELEESASARELYIECVEMFESLGEIEPVNAGSAVRLAGQESARLSSKGPLSARQFALWFGSAAAILLVCSAIAFALGRNTKGNPAIVRQDLKGAGAVPADPQQSETMVAGHASLRRVLDVRWADGTAEYQAGDLIPEGKLVVDQGVIELDFFCGATVVVEGPAELDVHSDWELTCKSGRLRANVPPAARGFVVNAADSRIVDLGTEFSLRVGDENTQLEVIDGEVEVQQPSAGPQRLTTGQQKWLAGEQTNSAPVAKVASSQQLERRRTDQMKKQFSEWLDAANRLRDDPRLLAYFPILAERGEDIQANRRISNAAATGDGLDGFLVGSVSRSQGRFGESTSGLEFGRPGARVRVRIDGTFDAFTFVTWVKIDSLQHAYNALFMADGYENGEPHWQINHEGKMMFSVMVDDSAEIMHYSALEDAVVRGAGRHKIYWTPVIWDLSKSGRWMHLVAVYDPDDGFVRQYVDGQKVGETVIESEWMVKQMHIGAAEVGNWGQPSRKTPSFAVRNLDGTIDELAIFNAALDEQEILQLFHEGRP